MLPEVEFGLPVVVDGSAVVVGGSVEIGYEKHHIMKKRPEILHAIFQVIPLQVQRIKVLLEQKRLSNQ